MSDKTDIMRPIEVGWHVPAHFKPAIEQAIKDFAQDGYIFDGISFQRITEDTVHEGDHNGYHFTVFANAQDIFRLGVKVGSILTSEDTSTTTPLTIDLNAALEDYVNAIRKAQDDHWKEMNFSIPKDEYSVTEGKRFWKIVSKGPGQQYGSVHCFVERSTGDIYKAATFNSPAKGVRGNITAKDRPVTLRDYYRK
jgi:hypothetical protein